MIRGDTMTMNDVRDRAPALDQPYYGAPIGAAFVRFWKKYGVFSGRASRSEFWWWYLIAWAINTVLGLIALPLGGYGIQLNGTLAPPSGGAIFVFVLWGIWGVATIIPTLAIHARRLHDANLRAWWILIALVPFVGSIILLVLTILPESPEGARFDRRS